MMKKITTEDFNDFEETRTIAVKACQAIDEAAWRLASDVHEICLMYNLSPEHEFGLKFALERILYEKRQVQSALADLPEYLLS